MRMRSSLVVRASDYQCTSCNGPGFDPSIRRHSGIWGAADEAVLNIVRTKKKKIPPKNIFKKSLATHTCYSSSCTYSPWTLLVNPLQLNISVPSLPPPPPPPGPPPYNTTPLSAHLTCSIRISHHDHHLIVYLPSIIIHFKWFYTLLPFFHVFLFLFGYLSLSKNSNSKNFTFKSTFAFAA